MASSAPLPYLHLQRLLFQITSHILSFYVNVNFEKPLFEPFHDPTQVNPVLFPWKTKKIKLFATHHSTGRILKRLPTGFYYIHPRNFPGPLYMAELLFKVSSSILCITQYLANNFPCSLTMFRYKKPKKSKSETATSELPKC